LGSARGVIIDMAKLLVEIDFAKSMSEAKRLIKQGAVGIDGKRVGRFVWYEPEGEGTRIKKNGA